MSGIQNAINDGSYNIFGLDVELGWRGYILPPTTLVVLKTLKDFKEVF